VEGAEQDLASNNFNSAGRKEASAGFVSVAAEKMCGDLLTQ